MTPRIIFIELLTARGWLWAVGPRLVWWRLRAGRPLEACCVIDGTSVGWALARASRWLTGVRPEPLRFRLIDVRDERGLLLRLRIAYQDLAEVQQDIMAEPAVTRLLAEGPHEPRLPAYLAKALAALYTPPQRQTLWRALLTIQVCAWHLRRTGRKAQPAVFLMERRPWVGAIGRYGRRAGVEVVPIPRALERGNWRRRLVTPQVKRVLYRLSVLGLLGRPRVPSRQWVMASTRSSTRRPRVGVEYYGHLNLDHPQCYSDLFFWRPGGLSAQDLVMTFNHEPHPLDAPKLAELRRYGIEAVAVRPKAAGPGASVFVPRVAVAARDRALPRVALRGVDGQWLRTRVRTYVREERAFWSELCEATGIKVYTAWFKYTETQVAIADALRRTGGIATIYQRAYDTHPSAETAIEADVVFAFSPTVAPIERRSGSEIPYLVTTGYLGDFRFPLLRQEAARVRGALQRAGATRIMAFADENSLDDERWHTGHAFERGHYAFLLERVLDEPWFGLVLKPKTPFSLRRRLGPVAELLARAEATGRCALFEEGQIQGQGSYPPAAAALAADVMVHGHLNAVTAGLDAALAGVPTLLVDRAGWSISPFYRLGVGRVVFTEWEALWRTCLEQWRRPGGVPGFGDWSPMLEELDPFRDGRAAARMGTYLAWLLDGFRAGLDRDTVMADAAERYAARWGRDKIARISPRDDGLRAVPVESDVLAGTGG